jgi:NAD(P)-dependent dehydrogenase (short-subunit alcohol dehydrogenase family)
MQALRGKVAVITGGASGIGRALADRALEEGMRIVLADIEQGALERTAHDLQKAGAEVLAVRTDVSQADQVADLAQRTLDAFDGVHVLFNNAGVAVAGPLWQQSLADWEWVLGVNLWGVIHGVRTFVPLMLAQDGEAHIVNTASMAGMITSAALGSYHVSKFGVVALSESLAQSLAQMHAQIKVSVLCPWWVNTRIHEAARNRPADLQNSWTSDAPDADAGLEQFRPMVESGMPAEQVADRVFDAIRREQFYIFTHPERKAAIQQRMENILQERNPV